MQAIFFEAGQRERVGHRMTRHLVPLADKLAQHACVGRRVARHHEQRRADSGARKGVDQTRQRNGVRQRIGRQTAVPVADQVQIDGIDVHADRRDRARHAQYTRPASGAGPEEFTSRVPSSRGR